MTLSGAHAVVTGGGTGIGAAIAHALAGEGARVTVIGRRAEPIEAVAAEIVARGGHALASVADASDAAALGAAIATARAQHGPVTIAVANAGSAATAPFERTDADTWRAMYAANVETTVNLFQATLPDLRAAAAGRLVAVASTAALTGYAYCSAYVAAKHAVLGLVRSLSRELAATPVTCNAVCPGFTDTAIADAAVSAITAKTGRSTDDARAELTRFNPQRRLIAPDEVARTVVWLCAPASGSITGQAIAVDGGETQ